jgi:cytochrome c-type biogenesis protein CcmH
MNLQKILFFMVLSCFCFADVGGSSNINYQYKNFLSSFKCVACQNQSLINSNAANAISIRKLVRDDFERGVPVDVVRSKMTKKFGSEVSMTPSFVGLDLLLWVVPYIAFCGLILWIIMRFISYKSNT